MKYNTVNVLPTVVVRASIVFLVSISENNYFEIIITINVLKKNNFNHIDVELKKTTSIIINNPEINYANIKLTEHLSYNELLGT